MPEVTISEVAAALRGSPQGRYTVLGFGYRTVDEFVARLESDDPLMPRLIPSVMRRLEAAEARALAQAERAEYEQLGRSVVETLQRYAHIGRR